MLYIFLFKGTPLRSKRSAGAHKTERHVKNKLKNRIFMLFSARYECEKRYKVFFVFFSILGYFHNYDNYSGKKHTHRE
jgi:hypothetical protein